jgi:uncharacterized protein (TIGR03086 family)
VTDPIDAAAARWARTADAFTARVRAVPPGGWDRPAPCDGWVARDVVRHLVEWVPGFVAATWGLRIAVPPVDDDPAAAWAALDTAVRSALADRELAASERDTPMGRSGLAATLDMIATTDVFLHTWDLARATGGDERLDPDEVHRLLAGMEPMDEALRASGHYGPRTPVPDDADEQTRLLAFIGRRP